MARSAPRAVALLAALSVAACSPDIPEAGLDLRVPPGATVRAVADSLAAHRVISNKGWFRLRARFARVDRSLKPGVYHFAGKVSVSDILSTLAKGEATTYHLTVPEGGTLLDLARQVEREMKIPADSLLRAAADSTWLASLGVLGPSAEGWLLPETFDFGGFTDAQSILKRFIAARTGAWDSTWDSRAKSIGFDRGALLTMASIIEAEALHKEELPTIAAVYRNRLRIGMPLQADPTIQYGYLTKDGTRKPRLYYTDYDFKSPWNTYLYPGLPPGPIGNPSRAAIEATLSPAPVKFLYFVADSDGHHHFSEGYKEHLRAIQKFRRPSPQ